jgi:uncharacterized protein YutE (UPF0331/DUF86 family)
MKPNTYLKEIIIMGIKHYAAFEVLALDEDIVVSLYDHVNDDKHTGSLSLDIDEAKALYEMLKEAIPKAEESLKKVKATLGES